METPSASISAQITRAALFAARKHAAHRRKGVEDEPYFNHLAEVADLLAQAVGDTDVNLVVAGFLHDSIEDVGVTADDLLLEFGSDVANLVAAVTDDKSLPKAVRKQLQIDDAPKTPERLQSLKLADKIANLRSLLLTPPADWSQERRREYLIWATAVVNGLASPHPWLKQRFDEVAEALSKSR